MGPWKEIINIEGNFSMCGVYHQDRLYLGGYGTGQIVSFLPLKTELDNSGEAILSMVVFKGEIYATSENNDMDGQRTRLLKRGPDGSWNPVGLSGYAAYFMTVWKDHLIVMTSSDLHSTDYWYSKDGMSFKHGGHFGDWLWVPVVYRDQIHILGHSGGAEGPGQALAVEHDGNNWVPVPALCGTPLEWQCAVEHNRFLFLGGGGWTLGRGTSEAAIYRFNGQNCAPVKIDPGFHEVQSLVYSPFNKAVCATFGQGFKTDLAGGSKIWASTDSGATWEKAGEFPDCPQLYVFMETPYGYVAAGGKQGNLRCFYFPTTTPVVPPLPEPKNTCPKCGWKF